MGIEHWDLNPRKLQDKVVINEDVNHFGVACSEESQQPEVGVFKKSGGTESFVGVVHRGGTLKDKRCKQGDTVIIKTSEEPARNARGLVFF